MTRKLVKRTIAVVDVKEAPPVRSNPGEFEAMLDQMKFEKLVASNGLTVYKAVGNHVGELSAFYTVDHNGFLSAEVGVTALQV